MTISTPRHGQHPVQFNFPTQGGYLPDGPGHIDIKAPLADEEWQTLQTNDIVWTAGGAGDKVNIFYSIDYGASWVGIDLDVDNVDFPATKPL